LDHQYDTARELFSQLKTNEFYRTIGFKEIAMIYGDTESSYRRTVKRINRVRYQEQGGTQHRTLQENTEKEGTQILDYIAEKSKRILQENDFTEDGVYLGHNESYTDNKPVTLPLEKVIEAAESLRCDFDTSEILNNPVCYEDPGKSVIATIDDVNVKKQKETREKSDGAEKNKRKYVHNTVVHVEKDEKRYTMNGDGIKSVLRFLIAFIFNNNLVGNRFQFFTDGHKSLNDTILKCFSWYTNIGIILDWYHLRKKCKEQLSMAMKGRVVRNQLVNQLMPLLWHGLTNQAICLLEETSSSLIKDTAPMDKLVEYLKRNIPIIPC